MTSEGVQLLGAVALHVGVCEETFFFLHSIPESFPESHSLLETTVTVSFSAGPAPAPLKIKVSALHGCFIK